MVVVEYLWQVICQVLQILMIGLLPYVIFALLMQFISNNIRIRLASLLGLKGYIYITAPGVMIHELSHAFFCLVFLHKIVEIKLFSPEADGTLGYVNHSFDPGNLFHRIGNFFIGTGPVWGGVFMLWVVTLIFLPSGIMEFDRGLLAALRDFMEHIFSAGFWGRWQSYCWIYLVLTISSHITLSPSDLSGAKEGVVTLLATVLLFELLLGWSRPIGAWVEKVLYQLFTYISSILGIFLLLTLLWSMILSVLIKKSR